MGPDFIGIGTEKAATTWLYNMLKLHPSVWMPPTKELRFFNDTEDDYSHFARVLFRKRGYKKSKNRFKLKHLKNIGWAYTYLFKKRSVENYIKLFRPSESQITGEITPSYGILDVDKIANIYANFPNTKIIYILRNPLYRDWSSVCMNYKNVHKIPIESQPASVIINKVTQPHKIKHSNYIANLDLWKSYFTQENIFVGFYEELQVQPRLFLDKLFAFLELSNNAVSKIDSLIDRKINPVSKQIPPSIKNAIARAEYHNILACHQKFNNQYTVAWVEEVEEILNK